MKKNKETALRVSPVQNVNRTNGVRERTRPVSGHRRVPTAFDRPQNPRPGRSVDKSLISCARAFNRTVAFRDNSGHVRVEGVT